MSDVQPHHPAHAHQPAHAHLPGPARRRLSIRAGAGRLGRVFLGAGVAGVVVGAAALAFWLVPGTVRAVPHAPGGAPSGGHPTTVVPLTAPPLASTALPTEPALPLACTPAAVPGGVYAIGDSVMIDAAVALQGCLPGIAVNAAVSRQWADGETVMRQVMAAVAPPAVVVVGLGTNGPITDADFDAMMAILHGASRVVFVTVHVDRPWQGQVDGVLAAGVSRYPTAVLADWQALAAQHPEWFYADGTHLPVGGPGAQALAWLIASRV